MCLLKNNEGEHCIQQKNIIQRVLKAVILEKMQDLFYKRYTLMSFVEHSSKWKLFTQCITSVLFPLGLYFNKRCRMVNQAVIQIRFETIVI